MKFGVTILLLCLSFLMAFSHVALCQQTISIKEDFNNNFYGWEIVNEKDYTTSIQNGAYIIRNAGKGRTFTLNRFVDERKDFVIEASFVAGSTGEKKGNGLTWGRNTVTNKGNYFMFSPDGHFIVQTDHKNIPGSNHWKKTNLIRSNGEPNVLRVEQRDETLLFFINNIQVETLRRLPFFDADHGLITFQQGSVIVDFFNFWSSTTILVDAQPIKHQRENLGYAINSIHAEINPIISPDGKCLYFSRKTSPKRYASLGQERQDIWVSTRQGNGWAKARSMGSEVNITRANNLTSVSSDHNRLIFYLPGSKHKGGFAVMRRMEHGWSGLEPIDIEIYSESPYIESCLSPDGWAILFTAKTKGNVHYDKRIDERDIYVSLRRKNETWTKPINLGPVVNTAGDEFSPFLAADGRTLYFATNGRPGFGKVDIFVTRRIGEGWDKWTEPVNLGPGVNTPAFDGYFTMPASGECAYLVSYHNSMGEADIFRVKMLPPEPDESLVLVSGKTIHARTKKPLGATIIASGASVAEQQKEATSNPVTGEFELKLPRGIDYTLQASATGFVPVTESLALSNYRAASSLAKEIMLLPLQVGEKISLNHVYFEQGKAILKPESFSELGHLVHLLKQHPGMEIELEGHTDNKGTTFSLQELSEQRVLAVKRYLVQEGVAAKRITGKGYGAERPLVKNDTEEKRERNRRVEFRITKLEMPR